MPKIIFRPNPVPPPFPPPGPTYDTTVYAKTSPFPVNLDQAFTIVFSPANVPAFNAVNIWGGIEPLELSDVFAVIQMTNEDFGEQILGWSNFSSDSYPYLSIEFRNGSDVVHIANLDMSQL